MKREGPDYRVRPAKHVERHLILDGLRRLRHLQPLEDYDYVGFGAQYFVDFYLLHRELGIKRMVSLESDKKLVDRCKFNVPFDSVTVLPGASWTHFGTMGFPNPTVVWTDYTDKLDKRVLADVDNLARRLPPKSVMLFTLNVASEVVDDAPHGRLESLEKRIGIDAVPHGTKDSDLDGWTNGSVVRQVLDEQIMASLTTRADGTEYRQIFNFHYRDGARMLTVGGILLGDGDEPAFKACQWDTLEAYRGGSDPLLIELPNLTMREMAHLDTQLPHGIAKTTSPGLNPEEVAAYASFYRHYPRYARVEVL